MWQDQRQRQTQEQDSSRDSADGALDKMEDSIEADSSTRESRQHDITKMRLELKSEVAQLRGDALRRG